MAKAKDLKAHVRNANKGTLRGATQIEASIRRLGFGRSIVVDRNDVTIAGNHVLEEAQKRNAPIRVVETDGKELVVVKRKDLDLESDSDKRAVELAVADNRTSQVGLDWDVDTLREEMAGGLDISEYFRADELVEEMERAQSTGSGGKTYTVKLAFSREQSEEFSLLVGTLGRGGNLDLGEIVLDALRMATRA